MAYVKLYLPDSPTTAIKVLCNSVTCAGSKNTESTPYANIEGPVTVQTQSFENMTINVSGVMFTQEAGTLGWNDVLDLYKHKFDNTNPAYIEVEYGPTRPSSGFSAAFWLTGCAGTTKIPVILESFNLPINVKNSIDGYIPTLRLSFRETNTE